MWPSRRQGPILTLPGTTAVNGSSTIEAIRFLAAQPADPGKRSYRVISPLVVVHRTGGFRFVVYTLDHEPAHIHITGAGQAKINLLGPNGGPEVDTALASGALLCDA